MKFIYLSLFVVLFFTCSSSSRGFLKPINEHEFVQIAEQDSFLFSKFEVTNGQYSVFLESIKDKNSARYKTLEVFSRGWIDGFENFNNEHLKRNYFSSPAFRDCPVVNISFIAAQEYCTWLSIRDQSEYYYYRLH